MSVWIAGSILLDMPVPLPLSVPFSGWITARVNALWRSRALCSLCHQANWGIIHPHHQGSKSVTMSSMHRGWFLEIWWQSARRGQLQNEEINQSNDWIQCQSYCIAENADKKISNLMNQFVYYWVLQFKIIWPKRSVSISGTFDLVLHFPVGSRPVTSSQIKY